MSGNQQKNNENAEVSPEQPRQPKNLQGLLRFAMEATKAEDAPGDSGLAPLDEERRKFLEEALASLTVDMTEVIQAALQKLTDKELIGAIKQGDPLPVEVQEAFNKLLELVDDIDVATDFYKLGGFAMFPICLGSKNDCVRAQASWVLGEVCQNNPFCQQRAMECGLLSVILSLVQEEQGKALVKAIYALSCACREYEPACQQLVSEGGCELLTKLLWAEGPTARTKAAFFIRYLCHNHPLAKQKFIQGNLLKSITDQIKAGRDCNTEHLLGILLALLEGRDSAVIRQCTDPAIGLKNVLEEHLKHPDLVDDSFMEEKEYCQDLLKILKSCPKFGSAGEPVDR